MTAGYVEFEFDLPEALLTKLIEIFAALPSAQLTGENIEPIPEAQGVYQLFLNGKLVYVGKTDAEAGLRKRLFRHYGKIQHRRNLDPGSVSFKAVRVYVFTAVDLEAQLIKHYNATAPVEWNLSGFGSNDPGRRRDMTRYKDGHFDLSYPIDIDLPMDFVIGDNQKAADILFDLKQRLPYTFRFESAPDSARKPHPDLKEAITIEPLAPMTVRSVITAVLRQLPPGWQATKLPSTLILYKEQQNYPQGEVIARSPSA
jgi:hypothetical protein